MSDPQRKDYQTNSQILRGPIMGLPVIFRRQGAILRMNENRFPAWPADSYAEFGACNKDGYLEMADKSEDGD